MEIALEENQFKTPSYVRKCQKEYRDRKKSEDLEAFNKRQQEYNKKYRERKKIGLINSRNNTDISEFETALYKTPSYMLNAQNAYNERKRQANPEEYKKYMREAKQKQRANKKEEKLKQIEEIQNTLANVSLENN
jgi:hypothetical protein